MLRSIVRGLGRTLKVTDRFWFFEDQIDDEVPRAPQTEEQGAPAKEAKLMGEATSHWISVAQSVKDLGSPPSL
jgi:hypothetical protein